MKKSYKILVANVLVVLLLLTQMMPVLAECYVKGSKLIQSFIFASDDPAKLGQTSVTYSVYKDGVPFTPVGVSYDEVMNQDPNTGIFTKTYQFERDLAKDYFAGTYKTVAQAVYDNGYGKLEHEYLVDPVINPRAALVAIKGQPYSVKFTTNLDESVTWSVYKPALPEGLDYRIGTDSNATVVNSVYMEVYGTPTNLGTYTFAVGATNGTLSVTNNYNLTVIPESSDSSYNSDNGNNTSHGTLIHYVELRQMMIFWLGSIKVSTLPADELKKIINSVQKGGAISLKVGDGTTSQAFEATGDLIRFMQTNSTSLILDYGNVKCEIPSDALDIDKLAADLKVTSVNDIKIHIRAEEVSDPLEGKFKFASKFFNLKIIASAPNGNSIEVTKLKSKIKFHLPVNGNISKPLVIGTRNVYRVNLGRLHFCNSVFDGTNYVVDITESGIFAVLDFQVNFSDVSQNHWAYTSIQIMASRSVMFDVYGSVSIENSTDADQAENILLNVGDFLPESGVTSRQLAGYLLQALNIGEENGDWNAQTQQDIAIKLGICDSSILSGADVSITREQMTGMVMKAYAYVSGNKLSSEALSYSGQFGDIDNLDPASAASIKAAYTVGVVMGIDANTFNPKSLARKDEAAALLARLLKVLNKL